MKSKTIFISVSLVIAALLLFYFLVFQYIVPEAARIAIPYPWLNLPIKQDSAIANAYLGEPEIKIYSDHFSETWKKGIKQQEYNLTILFNKDSKMAYAYTIGYDFKKWHIHKNYILKSIDMGK